MSSDDKSMKQAMRQFKQGNRLRRIETANCSCKILNLHVRAIGLIYAIAVCPVHGPCFSGDVRKIGKR